MEAANMDHEDCCTGVGDGDKNSQQQDISRSEENSPALTSSRSSLPLSSPLTQLPESVYLFFKNVPMDGYPEKEAVTSKAQPWRNIWDGPKPSPDGTLLIALPRCVDFGSNNLGGY